MIIPNDCCVNAKHCWERAIWKFAWNVVNDIESHVIKGMKTMNDACHIAMLEDPPNLRVKKLCLIRRCTHNTAPEVDLESCKCPAKDADVS